MEFNVAIIDAMAEIQMLNNDCETSLQLGTKITEHFLQKYRRYNELHVIFDTYKDVSLKNATREKRQNGVAPIYYASFNTHGNISKIANIDLKKLLSHTRTKRELTIYLAKILHEKAKEHQQNVVIAFEDTVLSTMSLININELRSNQEEADTKIILHAEQKEVLHHYIFVLLILMY